LKGVWTWVSQVRIRYSYPETTEEVIIMCEFTWIYIRGDEISIVYKTMKFRDTSTFFNWILKFGPKHQWKCNQILKKLRGKFFYFFSISKVCHLSQSTTVNDVFITKIFSSNCRLSNGGRTTKSQSWWAECFCLWPSLKRWCVLLHLVWSFSRSYKYTNT